METNGIIMAQIMGPALIIIGLCMLIRPDNLSKVVSEMTHSRGEIFIISLIRLIMGMIIITLTTWETTIEITMKLLGGVVILAAISGFLIPEHIIKVAKVIFKGKKSIQTAMIISLILGAGLTMVGYL